MPLIVLVLVLLVVMMLVVLSFPLLLIQRYRMGTARRPARGWVATVNVYGSAVSTGIFLATAAVMNLWVPGAFLYGLMGLSAGCVLGLLGLALSRWEMNPASLHYTPNRWLVLAIMLVVTSRIAYGFWRGWHTWRSTPDTTAWLVASGAAGSLAAGAVVVGYYLIYWIGIRRRLTKHQRSLAAR